MTEQDTEQRVHAPVCPPRMTRNRPHEMMKKETRARFRKLVYWTSLFWVVLILTPFVVPFFLSQGGRVEVAAACIIGAVLFIGLLSWLGSLWHAVVIRLRHDSTANCGWPFLLLFVPFSTPFYTTKYLRPGETPEAVGEAIEWRQWIRKAKWFLAVLAAGLALRIVFAVGDYIEANQTPDAPLEPAPGAASSSQQR